MTACVVCGDAIDPAGTVALPRDYALAAFYGLEAHAARMEKDDAMIDRRPPLHHDLRIAAAVVAVRVGTRAMLGAAMDALGDALEASVALGTPGADTLAFGRADAGIIIAFLDARAEELDAERGRDGGRNTAPNKSLKRARMPTPCATRCGLAVSAAPDGRANGRPASYAAMPSIPRALPGRRWKASSADAMRPLPVRQTARERRGRRLGSGA